MKNLIKDLIDQGYLKTSLIIEAFQHIKREDFILPSTQDEAHGNYPLPIGYGQTISQPLTVAFMLELLEPRPGDKILDVGSGSGWQTALLGWIVNRGKDGIKGDKMGLNGIKRDVIRDDGIRRDAMGLDGKVYAIERIPELMEFGKNNVSKYNFVKRMIVEFFCQDGSQGLSEQAPFDKIIVAAAARKVPEVLKKQLKVGGRLVIPTQENDIRLIEKTAENKFREKIFPGFVFVPLIERNSILELS